MNRLLRWTALITAGCVVPVTRAVAQGAPADSTVHRTTLDNGLQVIVAENHSVPIVTVLIAVRNGAMTQDSGDEGMAHLYEHLLFRSYKGDPDAFAALFDDHAQAVHRYATGLTGNWSAAEEVVSLTFLEAWRLRQTVKRDGGSLRPWLLGIAVNVTHNQIRAARRHQPAMSRLPPPRPGLPDFADEVTARLDGRDRLVAVRAAVQALPARERDVLICIWSGLDSAEAAQALGVPEGTVRTRLFRARRRLRELLDDAGSQAGSNTSQNNRRGGRDGTDQQQATHLAPRRTP